MRAPTRGLAVSLIACLALCTASGAAQADARLNAHFKISMTGVSIGQLSWIVDLNAGSYTTSANGKASGALSMLVNGEGRVATRGTYDGDRLRPTFFSSNVIEDGEAAGLQMTFESGGVKTLRMDAPPKKDDRIPVSEADRRGVTDPLTAMLIVSATGRTERAYARALRPHAADFRRPAALRSRFVVQAHRQHEESIPAMPGPY